MHLLLALALTAPDPHLAAARAHAEQGQVEEAIAEYEMAIMAEAEADRATAYCELTRLFLQSEEPERRRRALNFVGPCRASAPDHPVLTDLEVELMSARLQGFENMTLDQLRALTPKLEAKRQHRSAYLAATRRLVDLSLRGRDEATAETAMAAAMKRYPKDPELTCDLAVDAAERFLRDGFDDDAPRAGELLERCVELDPNDPDLQHMQRAVFLHRLYPWLLGGAIALLIAALILRWRQQKRG